MLLASGAAINSGVTYNLRSSKPASTSEAIAYGTTYQPKEPQINHAKCPSLRIDGLERVFLPYKALGFSHESRVDEAGAARAV